MQGSYFLGKKTHSIAPSAELKVLSELSAQNPVRSLYAIISV